MRDMTDREARLGREDASAIPRDDEGGSGSRAAPPTQPTPLHWQDRIEVLSVGEGAWRLSDRTRAEDDAHHVVAYAERGPDGIAVVWMHGGHARATFETIDQVAAAAHLGLLRVATERRRPIPIFHVPPMRSGPVRRRTSHEADDASKEDRHG